MSPEHAEMEAEWLADELAKAVKYARETYNDLPAEVPPKPRLALANLIGTLDALYSHYKVLGYDETTGPVNPADYPIMKRHLPSTRNPLIRFFFGDGN